MGLPVDEGLSVLYVLCRDWLNERSLLAALGGGGGDLPPAAGMGGAARGAQA